MARKRIEIDQKEFEKLCELQCSLMEVASWFRCSEDTIQRWCKRTYKQTWTEVFETYRGHGLIRIRRIQMQLAETSPQMAIWLGKQYLGQKDKHETTVQGGVPVVIKDDITDTD